MTFKAWMKNLNESQYRGNVGVWWVDRSQLYVTQHEVEDGKDFDGHIHSVTNHQKAWRSTVLNHRSDLASYSYTYLPRGRIYCDKQSKMFTVVGTPQLIDLPRFQAELCNQFGIEKLHVSHDADHHYEGDMGGDIGTTLKTLERWR